MISITHNGREIDEDVANHSSINENSREVEENDDETGILSIKKMANDLSESFNESYSVLAKHIRAYVGPKEEAEDFQVDNAYIERGYRINHNTAGRLCKSLCSCHNESVNVWSHIGGVTFFLCILISLCVVVIPN